MSLRGNISNLPVAEGLTVDGTRTIEVLIRIKSLSMTGVSLVLYQILRSPLPSLYTTTNTYNACLTVDSATEHADTAANYSHRGTDNPKEPHAVVDLFSWYLRCESTRCFR